MGKIKIIDIQYSLRKNLKVRIVNLITIGFNNFLNSFHKPKFKDYLLNSSFERKIENSKIDSKQIIVTCYFTKLKDPQHGFIRNNADFKYVQPWYESIDRLGLDGIIIHDGIDEQFIKQHQTEKIKFIKYTPGKYSIFEERWIAYYLLLINNPKIQTAFFTDGNDVTVNFNPFVRHNSKNIIYVGRDQANRVGDSQWVIDEMDAFIMESEYNVSPLIRYQSLFNAGLLGGSRNVLISVISKINSLTFKTNSDKHKDMSLLNIALYEIFKPKLNVKYYQNKFTNPENDFAKNLRGIESGYPFNSKFKGYERQSKATFTHK